MRILVITAVNYDPLKMFCQIRKLIKGLIRQGHDVLEFNYVRALRAASPFRGNGLSLQLYEDTADRPPARRYDWCYSAAKGLARSILWFL